MGIVVVGGNSKNVGKTSVVEGIIRALPEMQWTALKITHHDHGLCPGNGEPCDCINDQHTVAVLEERDAGTGTDSSRYLAAGAVRSFLVTTRPRHLEDAMPWVQGVLQRSPNVIVESNSIMGFLRPDVYLGVIDPEVEDFKASARQFLDRIDAVLTPEGAMESAVWHDPAWRSLAGVQRFAMKPPVYVSVNAVNFLKQRLTASSVIS